MITIKCVGGPWDGVIREVPAGMDPAAVLRGLASHGCRWEIDFSRATNDELLSVGSTDMTWRIIWALRDGRRVIVGDTVFAVHDSADEKEVEALGQEIEDTIVESGYHVKVVSDDQYGLTIRFLLDRPEF